MTDVSKGVENVEPRRDIIKGDYSFVDEVYDLYYRHSIGVVGF